MEYEAVIGMEVHVQLLTASKMFCGCSADYASAPPNTHVCPVCLGMPGVLPVINDAAVQATLRTGLALNCQIPSFSKFDRKNYPYPDLPKGYQISQYDYPLCVGGYLDIDRDGTTARVRVRRVHLEEDTGKLIHERGHSLIDLNRAGVPLMEVVTEADMRSADDAWQYLTKLRTILRYLGVSSGNMEEGAMRCEANVSVRPVGASELGTKVEVKNLNSFRAVRQSIEYELERQSRALDSGERIHQVTMGWDESGRKTVFQRSKESSEDYRYFPEPDLPPLAYSQEAVSQLRGSLPELPDAKRARFVVEYGLRPGDASLLVEDAAVAQFFEDCAKTAGEGVGSRVIANWVLGELFRLLGETDQSLAEAKVTPGELASLLRLVAGGTINATVAKEVLKEMFVSGGAAADIVERRGLSQISDSQVLTQIVRDVLASNPKPVQQYLEGKETVMGFFIGQVMRATRGQADANLARQVLSAELDALRT